MKSKAFVVILVYIIVAAVMLTVVTNRYQHQNKNTNTITVVTSFYPLYFFTSQIGKEHITVMNLTPAGAEPHDYEPSTQDILGIEKSRLLVINGAGLENWAEKLTDDLHINHVDVITAAEGLASRTVDENNTPIQDPHVWLDPILAQEEVKRITDGLIRIDPTNRTDYERNSMDLQNRLTTLHTEFKNALAQCKQKNIVTSHAAFGYMAARYGFNQIALTGLSPDQEPSSEALAKIANLAKTEHIQYIFFESLVSPRLAQTIAQEIGARTLVFNPLEGLTKEEEHLGKNYFSLQQENLQALTIALECK